MDRSQTDRFVRELEHTAKSRLLRGPWKRQRGDGALVAACCLLVVGISILVVAALRGL